MTSKSVRGKSHQKIKLLQDPMRSAAFAHYFERNWQAKRTLEELKRAGANIQHLREWALWSFHPLGADEAEEKGKRSLLLKTQLKRALIGYENAIACYSWYASTPHFGWSDSKNMSDSFQILVDMNRHLAQETTRILANSETSVYRTKRLGVTWNTAYLYLSKAYIAKRTGWNDRQTLGALTHLITAAKKSVGNRVPGDLRSLLRKAIRKFESDPENATIVGRLQKAVADPNVLNQLFPPLVAEPR